MNDEERYARLLDEKRHVTSNVTELARYIGFGLMVVFYLIHTGADKFATNIQSESPWLLYLVGVCGALVILLDYIQFFSASRAVQAAIDSKDHKYATKSFWYLMRGWMWRAKQIAALLGAALLLILVVAGTFFAPAQKVTGFLL